MRIGPLNLTGNLFLAPMADVTNLAFRMLCKKWGASLVFTEMTDADGIINQNWNTISRLKACDEERPFGIQLSGASAASLTKAARLVEEHYQPDIIDINFGCPARHILKKGCGAALLNQPILMRDIITAVCRAVNVPVTAKMRMCSSYEKTLDTASMLEAAGVQAITIHSRTRDQNYATAANRDVISGLKKEISVPVIANGDINDELSALEMLAYTGCDGIMIGRAAIGNPYIFRRIGDYFKTGKCLEPLSREAQVNDFFEYVNLLDKYDMLDYAAVKLHAKWFTKGIAGGKLVRIQINAADNIDDVLDIMYGLLEKDG